MRRTSILTVIVILLTLVFCVSCATIGNFLDSLFRPCQASPVEEIVEETVAPAVEEVKEIKEEVVAQVEQKASEIVEFSKQYFYEFAGNRIDIDVHNGYGYVSYPTTITDEELLTVAQTFTKAHGDFGVTFEKIAPGQLYITYPENLSQEDFDNFAKLVSSDLDSYIAQKVEAQTKKEEPVVVTPVVEPVKTEPVKVEAKPVTTTTTTQVATPVVEEVIVPEEPAFDRTKVVTIAAAAVIVVGSIISLTCFKKKEEN